MDQNQEMTVQACAWTPEAGEILAPAVPFCHVSELERQVEAGAVLFRVSRGADLVGYYLLRVDGREGVLVAGAGRDGSNLTASLVPHIERQFIGCDSIRIHTARPGMAKILSRMGYGAGEIVLRKKL